MIPITISTKDCIVSISDDGIKIQERIWIQGDNDEQSVYKGCIATGSEADSTKE